MTPDSNSLEAHAPSLGDSIEFQRVAASAANALFGAEEAMPVVGGFELGRRLGRGGMGTVYRAIVPFILLQALGIVICALFPELVLWLPNSMIN